ncbi:hypothetical protein LRP80_26200, partial [Burkholderia pseudomallei]|nr:hypothetical protein [Burkholderia pseudomallei]
MRAAAIEPAATRRRAPGRAFVRLTNVERGGDPNSETAAPSTAPRRACAEVRANAATDRARPPSRDARPTQSRTPRVDHRGTRPATFAPTRAEARA